MPKGYFLSAHRSPADPEKRAAYLEFAGPAPVSYTHLRAHETGINLVLRLRLEKK